MLSNYLLAEFTYSRCVSFLLWSLNVCIICFEYLRQIYLEILAMILIVFQVLWLQFFMDSSESFCSGVLSASVCLLFSSLSLVNQSCFMRSGSPAKDADIQCTSLQCNCRKNHFLRISLDVWILSILWIWQISSNYT